MGEGCSKCCDDPRKHYLKRDRRKKTPQFYKNSFITFDLENTKHFREGESTKLNMTENTHFTNGMPSIYKKTYQIREEIIGEPYIKSGVTPINIDEQNNTMEFSQNQILKQISKKVRNSQKETSAYQIEEDNSIEYTKRKSVKTTETTQIDENYNEALQKKRYSKK